MLNKKSVRTRRSGRRVCGHNGRRHLRTLSVANQVRLLIKLNRCPGSYGTRAKWVQEVAKAMEEMGQRFLQDVTQEQLEEYACRLRDRVEKSELSAHTAQNRISCMNTVLKMLPRKKVWVAPRTVGDRARVRLIAPSGVDMAAFPPLINDLVEQDLRRVAVVVLFARGAGMRLREACLAKVRRLEREMRRYKTINVIEGTKGGRGRECDRWVPRHEFIEQAIVHAKALMADEDECIVPNAKRFKEFVRQEIKRARPILKKHGIRKFHDLRAAWACQRYEQITGNPPKVLAGDMLVSAEEDREAREVLAYELGHGRIDVASAYVGGRR